MKEEFSGTAILVWVADGKIKHRQCSDQATMRREHERLLKTVPARCVLLMAVNWTAQEIMTWVGENQEILS
jgi:hypothetical protein